MTPFIEFPKIPRLSREIIITEKIDGTNGQITILDDGTFLVGSRTRWIEPGKQDNAGFAGWCHTNKEDLLKLGPGSHFGEWWGRGIQRGYGLTEKRFSLFNTSRWADPLVRPVCCSVVPVLYTGPFATDAIDLVLGNLARDGSVAAPGFMKPEGIIVFHIAGNLMFKKTIEKDDQWKGAK